MIYVIDAPLPVNGFEHPQGISQVDVEIEEPRDGAEVELGEEADPILPPPTHESNLAEHISESELSSLGIELGRLFDEDKLSRDEWERALAKGFDSLGFKHEDKSRPWTGAFGAQYPLIAEAVVRFQSNCIMEIFPSEGGPVKYKILGDITPDREDQGERVADYMNYVITERMTDYRLDTEKLLFSLACQGSAFRKVYHDPVLEHPDAKFIPAEDFVIPYGSSSLRMAPRYTEIKRTPRNVLKQLQASGFYRDVDIGEPLIPSGLDTLSEKKDKIAREVNMVTQQDNYELLEMHVDLDLAGFEDPAGVALPYVVTFERHTNTVLAIRRNWQESDPKRRKVLHYAAYHFIPALGSYGFGFIHLIGSMARGATTILQQLVDAGTLSNLPGGLKAKDARMKDDQTPVMPGEWRDVESLSGEIAKAFMPLPYKEPSAVLFSLLQFIVEAGRRLASTADLDVGEMGSQAPVGTTLAILERSLKIINSVQARVHSSLHEEFKILARVIREDLPVNDAYPYDVHEASREIKRSDFDGKIDVLPVSNPNSSTLAERVMQYQAAAQLSAQAPPGTYNITKLHREFLHILGIKDVDTIVPENGDAPLLDPVEENRRVLAGQPIKAYLPQNHDAHIQVHKAFLEDPKIAAQIGQNPQAQGLFAALQAHVAEHIGFAYRGEIEKQLGIPLMPPDQPLPADVEASISFAIAQASDRLFNTHQQEQQAQQAQQAAQDPMVQLEQVNTQIKALALKQQAQEAQMKVQADLEKAAEREKTERLRIASQHQMGSSSKPPAPGELEKQLIAVQQEMAKLEKLKAEVLETLARVAQIKQEAGHPHA